MTRLVRLGLSRISMWDAVSGGSAPATCLHESFVYHHVMAIANTIRQALADSGLSHRQIARATGVSQRAISQFIAGRAVNTDSLDAICEAMGARATVPKSFRKNLAKRIDDA